MHLELKDLENAIYAAKSFGWKSIPWAWIKYIQCGWVLKLAPSSCHCGGNWIWMKPRPGVGTMDIFGCAKHNQMDERKILDTKSIITSKFTRDVLQKNKLTVDDIGKIFFTHPGSDDGCIISKEIFTKLDPVEVGWWLEINDFDVS